jgi:apoptosis-inducing factor 3
LSNDDASPVDRPNLSKDYLAGTAPEEWIPLRGDDYYKDNGIDLRLKANVAAIDARAREVTLANGGKVPYDRLLLATGAEPVRLQLPGADLPHVYTLRSLADSTAIIGRAKQAKRAVVIGASFIGLEVAASLRARGLEVHVVAPETRPLERVLGPDMGDWIRKLHEEHGVVFHLGQKPRELADDAVVLDNGDRLPATFVVAGVGVRPNVELAEQAGLTLDRGIVVNEFLETSAGSVFAAGDVARYPDAGTGEHIRVEHWVAAERQAQTAARNMLGRRERFDAVPFFWSAHYDVTISYVGHAEKWDKIDIDGSLANRDCALRYRSSGKTLAVATIGRDRASLEAEVEMQVMDRGR